MKDRNRKQGRNEGIKRRKMVKCRYHYRIKIESFTDYLDSW